MWTCAASTCGDLLCITVCCRGTEVQAAAPFSRSLLAASSRSAHRSASAASPGPQTSWRRCALAPEPSVQQRPRKTCVCATEEVPNENK